MNEFDSSKKQKENKAAPRLCSRLAPCLWRTRRGSCKARRLLLPGLSTSSSTATLDSKAQGVSTYAGRGHETPTASQLAASSAPNSPQSISVCSLCDRSGSEQTFAVFTELATARRLAYRGRFFTLLSCTNYGACATLGIRATHRRRCGRGRFVVTVETIGLPDGALAKNL